MGLQSEAHTKRDEGFRSWYCLLASGRAQHNIISPRTEILEIPSVRHRFSTPNRPIPTGHQWIRASVRHQTTSEAAQGMPSPMTSTVIIPTLLAATLALSAAAPDTFPGETLVSQALAEILATRQAEMTSVASLAFASAMLAVAPASLLAIHLDPSAVLAATVSSTHPITRILGSAPAAVVIYTGHVRHSVRAAVDQGPTIN